MSVLSQASFLVDRSIASGFEEGTIAMIGYASTVGLTISSVFSESINNVVYPRLSSLAAEKKTRLFDRLARRVLFYASLIIVPIIISLILSSKTIISLVYGRGSFTSDNVATTAEFLSLYLPGILFLYGRDLLNRICYAQGNTKLPSICAASGFILTIALTLLLSRYCGALGIVMATSLASFISFLVELVVMFRQRVIRAGKGWTRIFIAIIFASIVSSGAGCLAYGLISDNDSSGLLLFLFSITFFTYELSAFSLNRPEIKSILKGVINDKKNQ